MIHKRYDIRAGATTTAGGIVRASSNFFKLNGAAVAREGDPVDCPACASQGVIECVMPRLSRKFEGKEYALSDDLCICKCNPPPKLIADQDFSFQTLVLASMETAEQTAARKRGASFDEQTKLTASSIHGMPYYVHTMDGRTFSGRVGADGVLPRIETDGEDEYTVLWGDEALAKMNNGQGDV